MRFNNTCAVAILAAALCLISCGTSKNTPVNPCASAPHFQKADNFGYLDSAPADYLIGMRDLNGTGELNSMMVIQNGKKVLEYYDCCYGPDFLNICWSASKTFTATAVGFAVQDGLLGLDTKVVDILGPDMLPATISDTLKALTVYNLLRMSSGLKLDPIAGVGSLKIKTPAKYVLEAGFENMPGDKYRYNSLNTYLLGVMVSKVTGKKLTEYLEDKLFSPLGISKYHWDFSAEGYAMGGWGLYLCTEDLAKMGQFFLQKGEWNGKQLLNREWMEQAMSAQIYQKGERIDDDWNTGYGYQMWCCTRGAYRLDGAHGQWVIICPEKNSVIVVTGNTSQPYKTLRFVVWDAIYDKIR